MKLNSQFLFYSLTIGALYAMFSSRLTYLVGGVFIGINYRDELTPYTEPVQDYVVEKAKDIQTTYFPDLKLPNSTPPVPKSRFESVKEMVTGSKKEK